MTTKTSPPWSPLRVFLFIWIITTSLYALNASDLQIYSTVEILCVILLFLSPFSFGYFFTKIIAKKKENKHFTSISPINSKLIIRYSKRTNLLTLLFLSTIFVETAVEGYIPLISMLAGQKISQFEFGIGSVHGATLALGAFCATANYYLFLTTKNKKFLIFLTIIMTVFALLVTRKMLVVSAIQIAFVHMAINGPPRLKTSVSYSLAFLGLAFVFGWIGDVRTGRELFLSLAHPRFSYPEWLPSGPMWVYIYLITPILNLTNAVLQISTYSYDFQFACSLLPSIFRNEAGCAEAIGFENEYQISGAFNVATGYIPFYMSWGIFGITAFSLIHGLISAHCYHNLKNTPSAVLYYSIVMQITVIMVFGNGFLNLNVLFQFFILLIFRTTLSSKKANRSAPRKTSTPL